jgi:hypothetical protein
MEDPHFDHRSAKRFDRQRASGPFGVDEILPKKITAWINRKHPETGKPQTLLNFAEWQRGQAARIIQDFELYVYEWTLTAVKFRESLDKQDKRDVAQSVFARDRGARLLAHVVFLRAQTLAREDDDEAAAEQAAENLATFQAALIDDLLNDADNDLGEEDRALIMTALEMTRTEFDLLQTLTCVYDDARSHFVFEICDPATKRFLNALRIREEEGGDCMPWRLYKTSLLERMQNSSTIDGLISFMLKPRENNCPISLWVAERIAQRRLLNDDGIEMSEDTWLELVLAFVTNEEKQTLLVPARDRRGEYEDGGNGYGMVELQKRSLGRFDPSTFRKFQQSHCHDPVAVRVVSLHKLVTNEKAAHQPRGKAKPGLESHAAAKASSPAGAKAKDEKKPSLPRKDGQVDQALYQTFPAKSLRRRLWDAIVKNKCPRCGGPHLRVACPKPRQGWEDDFEKEGFFTKNPPKAQARVQLAGNSRNLPHARILSVTCPLGRCLVDTCSDVSVARRDVLVDTHFVLDAIVVGHLGGEIVLEEVGTFELGSSVGSNPSVLVDVFVVEPHLLPAGVVALLGVADIRCLGLSLDAIMADPDCVWDRAIPVSFLARARQIFRRYCCPRSRPIERQPALPRRPAQDELATDGAVPIQLQQHLGAERVCVVPSWHGANAVPRRHEEELALLEEAKRLSMEEQSRRTANRVAELFRADIARKQALAQAKANGPAMLAHQSSSAAPPWPRKRSKFYAVRKGRSIGIFNSWEECERQVKGVSSKFKSFLTLEEAKIYMNGVRYTFITVRRGAKPASSFVGGKALCAKMDVWQDGHVDALRTECGLNIMSDVNLAIADLLHDIRDIACDDVNGCAGSTAFTREGTLKVLYDGEVVHVPALVSTPQQLPRSCNVLLGVPGLDTLGVRIDEHRAEQHQQLICYVGEKTLRKWWDANEGNVAPAVCHDITQVDVCPDLPTLIQAKVRTLLKKYEGVFEGRQVTMPKPFSAEPVELKFVSDPKPQSVPEPRWTHAQKQVLSQWANAGLKDGSLELSTSRWASRPHIVMKTPAHEHKDLVSGREQVQDSSMRGLPGGQQPDRQDSSKSSFASRRGRESCRPPVLLGKRQRCLLFPIHARARAIPRGSRDLVSFGLSSANYSALWTEKLGHGSSGSVSSASK